MLCFAVPNLHAGPLIPSLIAQIKAKLGRTTPAALCEACSPWKTQHLRSSDTFPEAPLDPEGEKSRLPGAGSCRAIGGHRCNLCLSSEFLKIVFWLRERGRPANGSISLGSLFLGRPEEWRPTLPILYLIHRHTLFWSWMSILHVPVYLLMLSLAPCAARIHLELRNRGLDGMERECSKLSYALKQ